VLVLKSRIPSNRQPHFDITYLVMQQRALSVFKKVVLFVQRYQEKIVQAVCKGKYCRVILVFPDCILQLKLGITHSQ